MLASLTLQNKCVNVDVFHCNPPPAPLQLLPSLSLQLAQPSSSPVLHSPQAGPTPVLLLKQFLPRSPGSCVGRTQLLVRIPTPPSLLTAIAHFIIASDTSPPAPTGSGGPWPQQRSSLQTGLLEKHGGAQARGLSAWQVRAPVSWGIGLPGPRERKAPRSVLRPLRPLQFPFSRIPDMTWLPFRKHNPSLDMLTFWIPWLCSAALSPLDLHISGPIPALLGDSSPLRGRPR